jgi:hypothetical protein
MEQNGIQARLAFLEKRMADLERLEIARTQEQVKTLHEDMAEVKVRLDGLSRTALGILISLMLIFGTVVANFIERISGG